MPYGVLEGFCADIVVDNVGWCSVLHGNSLPCRTAREAQFCREKGNLAEETPPTVCCIGMRLQSDNECAKVRTFARMRNCSCPETTAENMALLQQKRIII